MTYSAAAGNLMTVSYNRDAARYVKHYFAGTERILANVAGGGYPGVPVDMELGPLNGSNAKDVAKGYADFVMYYFNGTANKYACENNNIIYDAKIEMSPLSRIFKEVFTLNAEDKLYYFNANHLGSGSLITDGSGDTYQTIIYAPHGEILHNKFAGDYDEPYKFTGYERDNESGLNYAHARSQDVNLGFISTDPMWWKYPWISSYAYCGNNPVGAIDPNGEEVVWTGFGGKYSKIIKALIKTGIYKAIFTRFIKNQDNVFIKPSNGEYFGFADPQRTASGYNLFLGKNGFLKNGKLTADPTFIAKVVLHEGLHDRYEMGVDEGNQSKYPTLDRHLQIQSNTNGYEGEHETMAEGNIGIFISGMKQFDEQYGTTHSDDWYNAMAWFGSLQRTDDWKDMDSQIKAKYTKIIKNETAYMNYLEAKAGGNKTAIKNAKSKVNWNLYNKTRTSSQ